MTIAQQILKYACSLFDVVGANRLSSADSLLILGLESTPDRNLDEFGHSGGYLQIHGFRKHVKPRLESLLKFIHNQGSSAESIGRYGYPLEGEINLKEQAIFAGIGKRGKNTLVLHPKYGTRLRFAAVKTNAPVGQPIVSTLNEEENPVCKGCSICIDACPVSVLEPYRMTDPSICLSSSDIMDEKEGRLNTCDICLHLCPTNKD
ncbi:Epoxyqueuosine reductase [subsurface metagenome]